MPPHLIIVPQKAGPVSAARQRAAPVGEVTVTSCAVSAKPLPNSLTITLPYSLYKVPVTLRRELRYVSLSKNQQLRAAHGRLQAVLIRAAKLQVQADAHALMLEATAAHGYTMLLPLTLSAVIWSRVQRQRDDDGLIAAIWPARDAVAHALGIDDVHIRVGAVTFRKVAVGEEPSTAITLRGAEES